MDDFPSIPALRGEAGSRRALSGVLARSLSAGLLIASSLALGCGSSREGGHAQPPTGGKAEGEEVRAKWVFHPLQKALSTDELELEDGGRVEVDDAGSRWQTGKDDEPEVSAFGAPEPLTAIMKSGRRLASVGQSGAVYFSESALSPFVEVRTPPEPFVSTRRTGKVLVAVAKDGAVHRSENFGRSWDVVKDDVHFVELGVAGDGTVLGYAAPEQWFKSTDAGATFQRQAVETQAPRSMTRLPTGELVVEGLYQTSVYRRGSFERAEGEALRALTRQENSSQYSLPQFARASSVAGRRAVLEGQTYLALKPSVPEKPWKLARGTLQSPVKQATVGGLESCGAFRFAARKGKTAVACREDSQEAAPRIKIFRSAKLGADYQQVKKLFRGDLDRLKLDLATSGAIAVSDLCSSPEKGCSPLGVTFISREGKVLQRSMPGVPRPEALAFDSRDRLWLSGRREKDGHFIIHVDGGGAEPGRLIDLTRDGGFPAITAQNSTHEMHLLPGEGGEVSVALSASGRAYVALLGPSGQISGFGVSPSGISRVHGAGRLIAALEPEEGVLWESRSGGLSWSKNILPRDLCSGPASKCQPELACSEAGCLVGDELVRVGWGAVDAAQVPRVPTDSRPLDNISDLAGFECQVEESDWLDLSGILEVPDAVQAALGEAAWTGALRFPDRAALTAISVPFGKKELEREVLLAPVKDGSDYAFYVKPQVEGVAAARFRLPKFSGASSLGAIQRIQVEVAWDSRIAGVYGSATIDQPGPSSVGSLFRGLSMFQLGEPELISVAGRGLYFRFGASSGSDSTFFVRGRGKHAQVESMAGIRYPQGSAARGGWLDDAARGGHLRSEPTRVNGEHLGLLLFSENRVISVARGVDPSGAAQQFHPFLMGLLSTDAIGYAQSVRYAYRGENVGFISLQVSLDGPGHRASFVELDAEHGLREPVAVPLQQDLPSRVRPCVSEQRKGTPRVIAPATVGTERRVTVLGAANQALDLVTARAVLHGTPESPCVAAFDGRQRGSVDPGGESYAVLVFPGGGSWIFRSESSPSGLATIAGRPMTCVQEGAATK